MSEPAAEKVLNCPKCNEPMRQLKAGTAIVDRCEKCYGIWVDKGERIKLLKDKSLVTGVDIGSVEQGREQDQITEVDCPRCATKMLHVTDKAQKHIGFEHCRKCDGSFFDAGELTDLSEFTLSERIRTLIGR
jgi:Zn-finger nucleic acid-binding protein